MSKEIIPMNNYCTTLHNMGVENKQSFLSQNFCCENMGFHMNRKENPRPKE